MEIDNAELTVVLGARPSPAEKRVTELLAECIKDRTGISLAKSGSKAKLRLWVDSQAKNARVTESLIV